MTRAQSAGLLLALLAGSCSREPAHRVGGDPIQGARLIERTGCGACHVIPGIAGARGRVGPPLRGIGSRTVVAGVLPNTPANMARWVREPQAIQPGDAMPDTALSPGEARDVAAYLAGLR